MMPAPGTTSRRLADIVEDLVAAPPQLEVTDLTVTSSEVRAGGAFLACAGRTTHGLVHAAEAIARGARVILWEPAPDVAVPQFPSEIFAAPVPQLRARLGAIADRFFDAPSALLTTVGITGTNGKTTTAWLAAEALAASGRRATYSGTLGFGAPGALQTSSHTTPDAVSVHRRLAALRDAGADCVAMEVSSHALDQGRVAGVRFHTALFTNLTRDHLDYHGTMDEYGAAKSMLFAWPTLAARIINIDGPLGSALAKAHAGDRGRLVTVSRRDHANVRATGVRAAARGVEVDVATDWGAGTLATRLIGDFNADNALAVLALLLAWDVPFATALRAIGECNAPPGRMQSFGGTADAPLVIVDYAHTPDALDKALAAARAHAGGKLAVVFGCGGDRDPGKRPMMGEIAARRADRVFITDDNPRTEAAGAIVAQIAAGIPAGTALRIEHDRAAAIRAAIDEAGGADVVLVAGKGHEDYQLVGHERRPFSDQAVVQDVLGGRT